MKNRKSFLKGALCGALAMLLVAGLVSCGLKVNNGNSDITSKTEDKILELQNLIEKHYMGDVKEKNLEDGVYKGYINGLNDPYSVYYNKKETKELAVMIDPFRPFQLTEEAMKVEDPTYLTSWLETTENHLEDRSQE